MIMVNSYIHIPQIAEHLFEVSERVSMSRSGFMITIRGITHQFAGHAYYVDCLTRFRFESFRVRCLPHGVTVELIGTNDNLMLTYPKVSA